MYVKDETMTSFKVGAVAFAVGALGAALTGRSFGTALAVGAAAGVAGGVGTALLLQPETSPQLASFFARANRVSKAEIEHGFGALQPPALRLLSKINSDELFAPRTFDGWVIGDVPANEYEVAQR